MQRRNFIKLAGVTAGTVGISTILKATPVAHVPVAVAKLDAAASAPVLKRQLLPSTITIASIELLRYRNNFLVRVRSKEGAEGLAVSNNAHMVYLYPIVLHKIIPMFIGKDARDLDKIVDDVYLKNSTYKLQGLALWVSLASVEFAVLDMLGRIAGKPVGELIGKIETNKIAVYRANNYRGKSAQESIERIKENVAQSGAKATKFKIGGRMSNNADFPPDRTEKLVPLMRKTFPDLVLYADSNGSYTVDKAIEIGRLLEEHDISFYEEPTPFDWLEETRAVADALDIPIAGGEQESSLHRFRWLIAHGALQVVQPDLFYFGGMIRSMRVARMARAAGIPCTPHISGSGLGYVYMLHFVSCIDNAGPFHEFKGINKKIPLSCATSSLQSEDGIVTVPSGAGFGIDLDPEFVVKHKPVAV